jgi:hypothetical protein
MTVYATKLTALLAQLQEMKASSDIINSVRQALAEELKVKEA